MTSPIDLASLERIGQGRAAEVFALDGERVIKLMRSGGESALQREATALRAAAAAGIAVPIPSDIVTVDGRPGLVMSRVRGRDMLTLLAVRPWTIRRAGAELGSLHARLHEVIAPPELPTAKGLMVTRIVASDRISSSLKDRVLALLAELPEGDRLCHLDFVPSNVIVSGGDLVIIDWPGACRGDPLCDVASTSIALEIGKEPPGTALATRLLAPLGRKLLLHGYLQAYRTSRPIDRRTFARWRTVLAAERLTYDIPGEERRLIRIIEAARLTDG